MAFLGGQLLSGKKTLAQGLSQDLGQSLQGLAQHKATQMQNKQKAQLWQSLGLDPETSLGLAAQPEAIQKSILDRLEGASFGAGQQNQQQAPIQNQMQQSQQQQPTYTPEQEQVIRRSQNPEERQKIADLFRQHNQQQAQPQQVETPNQQAGQAAAQQQAIEAATKNQGVKLGANPADRRHQESLAQARELAERKENHALQKYELEKYDKEVKESKDYLKTVKKSSRATKENNMRLDRMENLARSGKLNSTTFSSGLDTLSNGLFGFGINLKSLQSPETQEFEKLSFDMLKGIQDIFGSRILKTEVDNFLKTIPTLQQSNAGKIAVIDNLKLFNEAKIAQEKVASEIIKENNGIVPPDLELKVDERLDPYLDKIAEKFNKQEHKPVAETSFLPGVFDFINPNSKFYNPA